MTKPLAELLSTSERDSELNVEVAMISDVSSKYARIIVIVLDDSASLQVKGFSILAPSEGTEKENQC